MKIISLVIPVYCEEQVVDETYRRLKGVLSSVADYEYELIFVDDGNELFDLGNDFLSW